MDHKKISLNPDDLKKLQALLKKEESLVEAMSDEELDAAEKALEKRIKDLPHFAGDSSARDREMIDAGWQKLQKQLNPSPLAAESQADKTEKDNVVAFQKPKRSLPWGTIGALAAAALALLVFYPVLRQGPDNDPADLGQMQTKGVDANGQAVYTAFCDIDIRGPAANSVEEAGNGQGYEIDPQVDFNLSVSCDRSGYIQVWSRTTPAAEVRDSRVEANVRSFVVEEGKVSQFSLSGKPEMILEIALTGTPIALTPDLFEVKPPVAQIGQSEVLWMDSLIVRENK